MIIMEFKLNDYHRNVTDKELLDDIIRVANTLDKDTLTIEEYDGNGGKYARSTYARRFGGWIKALQLCGLKPNNNQTRTDGLSVEEIISDLQKVSQKIGKKTFNSSEYNVNGNYSTNIFYRKFGSWNNALVAAGLEPFDHPLGGGTKNKITEYQCVEEIERVWIELGRQPTTTDIKNGVSKYSLHVFERRFGSWRKALEFFVSYMNGEQEVEKPDEIESDVPDIPVLQQPTNKTETIHKTKRDINLRTRFLVMKRDNFKCCMCGRSPATTPGLELHIDHIKPWAKGGETVIDNLQTLCSECNLGKSDLY